MPVPKPGCPPQHTAEADVKTVAPTDARNVAINNSGALFFFQAEDGIRDAQESRGLGDVYKRQELGGGAPSRGLGDGLGSVLERARATIEALLASALLLVRVCLTVQLNDLIKYIASSDASNDILEDGF